MPPSPPPSAPPTAPPSAHASHHAGPTPERFFNVINAFEQSAAMKSAIELSLFTAIAEGHNTAEKLAAKVKVAVRGARILADFLAIMGFLTKSGGGATDAPVYALAEDAALFLDKNSPAYIGGAVEFLGAKDVTAHFEALTQRVRNGGAPLDGDNSLVPNHEMWVHFARGMAGLMTMPAQMLAKHVLEATGGAGGGRAMKVLDIAAGHGMFGIAVAQQNPQAKVVGLDWGIVLKVALENAAKFGVADRYSTLAGSAFEVVLGPGEFDVVLIPNFLHHFDVATNVTLLKKVHAALKPGGMAATLEFAPESDRLTPPGAGAFALVMLASTPAGDAYTVEEITGMYAKAGFKNMQAGMLPMGMQRVITGVK